MTWDLFLAYSAALLVIFLVSRWARDTTNNDDKQ